MTAEAEPRIAIVDADANLLEAVKQRLKLSSLSVRTFQRADEFLSERPEIDCLVVDLQLPGMAGDELHAQWVAEGETATVIMTTRQTTIAKVVGAIQRGALTVLEKPYDLDVLYRQIEIGLAQTTAVRQTLADRRRLAAKYRSLTQREREVFRLLLTGMSVKQIGLALGIGVKTVHTFRSNILQKMVAESNTELVRRVVIAFGRAGIEQPDSLAQDHALDDLLLMS